MQLLSKLHLHVATDKKVVNRGLRTRSNAYARALFVGFRDRKYPAKFERFTPWKEQQGGRKN